MSVQFVGSGFYPADEPPKFNWSDDGGKNNRLWYEERPRMILHYYRSNPNKVSAFVNLDFKPTIQDIQDFMERGLKAGDIVAKVSNVHLNNMSGDTNAFYYADVEL